MHGSVHDFVVSQTVKNWRELPTGHGGGALIPTIIPIEQPEMEYQLTYPKILEIGSLNINGSMREYNFINSNIPWRQMIGNQEYIGIDLVYGPDVDYKMDAHDLLFKEGGFDLVICLDMLEHDSDIKKTLTEAYRVLKPGGLLLVTTVDENMGEHMCDHPVELPYNHITESQLKTYLGDLKSDNKGLIWDLWHFDCDLFIRIEKPND